MAKKIRFPLEMENGVVVRSMEELRENFSLPKILGYLPNGKLVTWLRDRYEDEKSNQIEKLDVRDSELSKKICQIFSIEYTDDMNIDFEKVEKLQNYTKEQKFLSSINITAFEQEDIYKILDDGATTIHLCGERFTIPISKNGITYIGVNKPVVAIESGEVVNFEEKDIKLIDVEFNEEYKKVLENNNSYIRSMLSESQNGKSKSFYNMLIGELKEINFNLEDVVSTFRVFFCEEK